MSNILKVPVIRKALHDALIGVDCFYQSNQCKMAIALGISRGSLRKYLKEFNML